ncbi:MAG: hypothetical protein R3322_06060 [Kiloniellales bacterium]|nr:hypothetical protein [Kiloniellales bacterium]
MDQIRMDKIRCDAPRGRPRIRAAAPAIARRSPVLKESGVKMGRETALADSQATSLTQVATIGVARRAGRLLGLGLAGLGLAGLLWALPAGSALAGFASAVAAYERGELHLALHEFESLAAAGDRRAAPYLEAIRGRLEETGAARQGLDRFAHGHDRPAPPPAAPRPRSLDRFAHAQLHDWPRPAPAAPAVAARTTPTASAPATASAASRSAPRVVVPRHESVWSSAFHLPGDATVIGLQYVAEFLDAETLGGELRAISRNSNEIALSVLAGVWWLAIVRGAVGLAIGIAQALKAAAPMRKARRYG